MGNKDGGEGSQTFDQAMTDLTKELSDVAGVVENVRRQVDDAIHSGKPATDFDELRRKLRGVRDTLHDFSNSRVPNGAAKKLKLNGAVGELRRHLREHPELGIKDPLDT